MIIFTLLGEEESELVHPVDQDSYALLYELLDGTPREGTWVPFPMRIISKGERRRSLRKVDAPWLGSNILILRSEAAESLRQFLTSHGELLPLACEQAELVAFNPLSVIDALDETASTVKRLDDGHIWWVGKYVFHKAAVQGLQAFKLTNLQPSPLFVGEEFLERWRAAGLRGLEFRQVWEG